MALDRNLIVHALGVSVVLFVAFAASSVGDIDAFKGWLLGYATLPTRNMSHLLGVAIAVLIALHYVAKTTDPATFKAIMGGAVLGFLAALLAGSSAGTAPIIGIALTATGAVGGWAFLPRA